MVPLGSRFDFLKREDNSLEANVHLLSSGFIWQIDSVCA